MRIAEDAISCALLQSGFPTKWWAEAGDHATLSACFSLRGADGKTPFERKFDKPFTGVIWPFGAAIKYRATPPEIKAHHPFSPKQQDGLFFGWDVDPGGAFHGNYNIMRLDDFESEKGNITPHMFVIKEVTLPETVRFPLREVKDKLWLESINPAVTDEALSIMPHRKSEFDAPDPPKEGEPSALLPSSTLLEPGPKPWEEADYYARLLEQISPTRKYAGTTRPPYIPGEVWNGLMSVKEKELARREYQKQLDAKGRASADASS